MGAEDKEHRVDKGPREVEKTRKREGRVVIEETWETRGMEAGERIQKGESGDKDVREYKEREATEETRRRHSKMENIGKAGKGDESRRNNGDSQNNSEKVFCFCSYIHSGYHYCGTVKYSV